MYHRDYSNFKEEEFVEEVGESAGSTHHLK
jgi:hypothetical protein